MFITKNPKTVKQLKRFSISQIDKTPITKILYFGSDNFSLPSLKMLTNKYEQFSRPVTRQDIVTTQDKLIRTNSWHPIINHSYTFKLGYKVPVTSNSKDIRKTEWDAYYQELLELFKSEKEYYDIGVICSYGYMIDDRIIDLFPKGLFVIHPSLLPKYRGASPIQQALLMGDTETGVSIVEASKRKFDAGPIWAQVKVPIEPQDTYNSLSHKLANKGSGLLGLFLDNYMQFSKKAEIQDEAKVTKAPMFLQGDNIVKVDRESFGDKQLESPDLRDNRLGMDNRVNTSEEMMNRYRGFHGSSWKTIRLKFLQKYFYVDEMSVLLQENLKSVDYTGKNKKILIEVWPMLEIGQIWYMPIKGQKGSLFIKMIDGWVVITQGHQQGDHKTLNIDQFAKNNLNLKLYQDLFSMISLKNFEDFRATAVDNLVKFL